MWPPFAGINRSKRGRKPLQIFLTQPFFIDRHARFTEVLSSYVLLWRALHTSTSICVHKLKMRGFKSGSCAGQKLMLASNQSCSVFLCRVCRHSVLLEDVVDSFIDARKNFYLQNFFVNGGGQPVAPFKPNWRHLLPARCYDAKAWLLTLCDVQRHPS